MTFGHAHVRATVLVAALVLLPLGGLATPANASLRTADPTPSASQPTSGSAASPSPSGAQASPNADAVPLTFGLKPQDFGGKARANFRFQMAPGQSTNDAVSVYNLANVPLQLQLYATDAYTNPSGTIVAQTADKKPLDAGTWINLLIPDNSTLVVPARSRVNVPFRVRIPAGASPGDHAGAIVVSLRGKVQQEAGGPTLAVDSRVSTSVNVRVAGQVISAMSIQSIDATYAGTLHPFQPGSAVVRYRLKNTGNVAKGARVDTTLAGLFGTAPAPNTTDLPVLTPGSEVDVEVPFTGVWPTIRYTATISVTPLAQVGDPVGDIQTAGVDFWAIPWPQIAVAVALLLLLAALWVWARRRATKPAPVGRREAAAAEAARDKAGVS